MEDLNKDVLLLLAMQMDLPTLNNFCRTSKRINEKVCNNDIFWRNKLEKDFPGFIKHPHIVEGKYKRFTDKEEYIFLTNILTSKRFEEILKKPDIASDILGIGQNSALDLYDLLYNQFTDRDWGVINIKVIENFIEFEILLNEAFDTYLEGQIGRTRSFLNEIKQGKFQKEIEEYVNETNQFRNDQYSTKDYITFLLGLESDFQNYIRQNTSDDVRQEIKRYQDNLGDEKLDVALYDDKEIEFLQILHDGIKTGKLSLFDPVDYDFLMSKLKM